MNLREMLNAHKEKRSEDEISEIEQAVVDMYERQAEIHKNKKITFLVRITADQLGMKYDAVQEILEKHYSDDV